MFDIAWGEFVVIAVVALIVIGPKELPGVLRAIGQWTTKIRRMAAEFQGQFQEALREAEMADLKKEVDNLNDTFTDTAKGFTSQFDDPLNLKEATKWEPQPDAAQPDAAKSDQTKSDDTKSDDTKPDDAAKPADAPPGPASVTAGGEEAFPVAAEPSAVAQMSPPTLPSAAGGGGGNGAGAATEAAPAPPVTPPAAQPPLPEGSGQRGSEGGVRS
jgi:sec-independent protein translocase protein TatB